MARILDSVQSPANLHELGPKQLQILANEVREEIVHTVKRTGGHLGASLGAVELILAVHSIINSPVDKLIFDVGHQAYPHKLVTGRLTEFPTLRQHGGLCGFPRMVESPHDAFGVGHAGTSISAALGYCLARDARGEDYRVVTITGDGALTSGMAFEAMNHAGELATDLVVILNDNEMSIGPNVGALANYLTRLRTDPSFHRAKEDLERLISRIPAIGSQMWKVAERLKDTLRYMVVPGAFFEELGFAYYGPIDGHNIPLLQRVLQEGLGRGGPVLIHAITQKGKGYGPAENDPVHLHTLKPALFSASAVQNDVDGKRTASYSEVFGTTLLQRARDDKRIVAITAAMPEGTGLDEFAAELPGQFHDVAIAEQHAVTLAAGLAAGGMRAVCAIYSTFMQRAFDQVLHDVCLQNLPVTLCLDRAGLVGDDGPTHHGVFDLSYLRLIPNLVVMAPSDGDELRDMLQTALSYPGPVAIRYPKGMTIVSDRDPQEIGVGQGVVLRRGSRVALLAIGSMVERCMQAADMLSAIGISTTVANARFAKPIDEVLLAELVSTCECLLTVEENVLAGGFGSAVLETLARRGESTRVRCLGLPDAFVEHGSNDSLLDEAGLSPERIAAAAKELLLAKPCRHGSPALVH